MSREICKTCNLEITTRHKSIRCSSCSDAYHTAISRKCIPTVNSLNADWKCTDCQHNGDQNLWSSTFNFHDELFDEENSSILNIDEGAHNEGLDYEPQLPRNRKFLHLNINGLKSKYEELRYFLVSEYNVVACSITETKLNTIRDPVNQFSIPSYNCLRNDRIQGEGGGVLVMFMSTMFMN